MKQSRYSKLFMIPVIAGAALLAFTLLTPQAFAQENATGDEGLNKSLLAVAAAIAIAGGLIGTGNAEEYGDVVILFNHFFIEEVLNFVFLIF